MRGDVTQTSVKAIKLTETNATTHAPFAAEVKVTIHLGSDGEWTSLEVETKVRPVIAALTN